MPNLKPISTKQFVTTIAGQKSFFTKVSGIQEQYDTQEYNDGEIGQTQLHLGYLKVENVTLSKVYDPVQDKELIAFWNAQKKERKPFTVSVQPVNPDLSGTPISGAQTLVLNECLILRFKYPEADREGSGMAMLEIEIKVGSIANQ